MSLLQQPRFLLMVLMPMLMMLSLKELNHGLKVNLKTLHKQELREYNNQNKPNKNGKQLLKPHKKQLMLNF
jgi:hypothetical protein